MSRGGRAALIAGLAVGVALGIHAVAGPWANGDVETMAVQSLALEVFLAIMACAGAALARGPLVARLGLGRARIPGTSLALLAAGTVAFSFALYGALEISGLKQESALAEFERQLVGIRGRTVVFVLVGVVLAPGVAEEILCRGFFQWGLVPVVGAPAAIGISALVFGAFHLDPVHAAFATLLGVYLGIAAHLAGSVRASILCHLVNNLGAVLSVSWSAPQWVLSPFALAIALAMAALALLLVRRNRNLPTEVEADPEAA